tara:strand:- start:153 stop:416 length:264 start_codon:yes stop_codon:yes gene_type:complete
MKKKQQDEKLGEAAAEIVSDTVHTLNELGIDQDYAAYLLLSAGMGLAIMGNRNSPIVTTQLLASAMMVANQQIMHMEDDDDDKPKYH